MNLFIPFRTQSSRQKPNGFLNAQLPCPFCDRDTILRTNHILRNEEPFLLMENKYPAMEDCYPTVLIEDKDCSFDLSTYPKDHLYRLFEFTMNEWFKMEKQEKFSSVVLFKNHGPFSGGSLHHPHMQIIGFHHLDYRTILDHSMFEGVSIYQDEEIVWNISTKPRTEFYEFNIIVKKFEHIEKMADFIQYTTHYILNHLNSKYQSYNIAFYHWNDRLYIKIISRTPTSPLFMGYNISQVPNNLSFISEELVSLYLDE